MRDHRRSEPSGIYELRFDVRERKRKMAVWREIGRYLQKRYIPPSSRVMDVASDLGYFISSITAAERWASDMRDTSAAMPDDVRFLKSSGLTLADVAPNNHFDIVFMSNYLEHLHSSDEVVEQLSVAHRLLRPGGRIIILQPNIRLVGQTYWDFIDHRVPLTEISLQEAAALGGFEHRELITRFLPYTAKSRLPTHPILVRLYLRFPPVWRLMGKQTLYVGQKPAKRPP